MDTATIARAFAQVAKQRIENGEKVYRAKIDGGYIGRDFNTVKTKKAALTMICDDLQVWRRQTLDKVSPITLEIVKRRAQQG